MEPCPPGLALSIPTCRNIDMWSMLAVASVGRPGDDSSLGDGRTATWKGWDPGMTLCSKAAMATTREKNSHLFVFQSFFFAFVYILS